jgi:hypothetical protein
LARNSLESLLRSLIFAHFGQNLRFSGFKNDKFAAKFAAAGNLKLRHVSQFLDSPLLAASLPVIVFYRHFSAARLVHSPALPLRRLLTRILTQFGTDSLYLIPLPLAQQHEFKSVIKAAPISHGCVHAQCRRKLQLNYFAGTQLF